MDWIGLALAFWFGLIGLDEFRVGIFRMTARHVYK
jgi:hypothetical protein